MHTTRVGRAFHLIAFKLTRCLFDVIELNMNGHLLSVEYKTPPHVTAQRFILLCRRYTLENVLPLSLFSVT